MEQEIEIMQENIEKVIPIERENVSIGIIPTGTLNITTNGNYDVTNYKNANVITSGIIPTGTLSINSNGNYDVTQYAGVNVNIAGITELVDGSYLFSNNARVDMINTLLPTLQQPTNLEGLFYNSSNITSIDLTNLNTSNTTNMSYMFSVCAKLRTINGVEDFDTSNVTNMHSMFYDIGGNLRQYTSDVINLDLTGWDTSNVTNVDDMFSYFYPYAREVNLNLSGWDLSKCTQLYQMFAYTDSNKDLNINFSGWDVHNVTSLSSMFNYNQNVKELDLSSFYTPNLRNTQYMFADCYNLTRIDMRNFVFTNILYGDDMFSGVPDDCLIIVADNTQKQWILDRFSNLTNVKTINEL